MKEIGDSGKLCKAKCPVCNNNQDVGESQIFFESNHGKQKQDYIGRSYTMDVFVKFPKNTLRKVEPMKGCAKFAL